MLKLTAGTQNAIIKVSLAVIVLVIMYFVWTKVISPKENFEGEYAPMDMSMDTPMESYEASEPEDFSAETYEASEPEDFSAETYDDEETYNDAGEYETYEDDAGDETYDDDAGEETYDDDAGEETYGDEAGEEAYEEEAYDDGTEHEMYSESDGEMYDDMNEGFSVMEPTVDDAYANALFTAPVM